MSDRKKRNKSLLDDDDDDDDDDDGGSAGAPDFGIRVNKAFAARFEHNKRREELHRLKSKYPEEAEKLARKITREAAKAAGQEVPAEALDSDDSSDEEDEGDIPVDTEAKIFETLLRIRSHDPAIYQKDVKFFGDDDEDEGDDEQADDAGKKRSKGKSKKAKAMFLKDLIAKQALEHGPEGSSSDDDALEEERKRRHPKAYDPEQEGLRKAFLDAAVEADEDEAAGGLGGVLRLRSKGKVDEAGDADGAVATGRKGKKSGGKQPDGQFQKLIEAYFGSGSELHPDDKFLKEYIVNKGWVDREDGYVPSYHEVVGDDDEADGTGTGEGEGIDDDEDERYLREVDAFEAKYNFRYEEPGADRIITHPRNVEGIVRKPDDKRKRARDAKKQRLQEAEEAAREDVKRLKNLKKQEIEQKLEKLREVAGAAAPAAASLDDMLEGDFDPEEWDKKMAAAFDDAYYDAEEDLEGLQEDLDLLAEEEDEDEAFEQDGGDGKALRFSIVQAKLKELDALNEGAEEDDGDKASRDPEVAARQRAELQRLLEEYYKLDYEDDVGGIKTRFRYKEVPASTFGLSMDEILRLDDKSLNQVVGIKRLAPYREDLSKLRPNYKALEAIKNEIGKQQRRANKKRDFQKRPNGANWWRDNGHVDAAGAADAGPRSAPEDARAGSRQQKEAPGKEQDPGALGEKSNKKRKAEDSADAPNDPTAKAGPGSKPAREGKDQVHGDKRGGKPEGSRHKGGRPQERPKVDPVQARLASYAVPTLKKESVGGHGGHGQPSKKGKHGDGGKPRQDQPATNDGPQMTRAQKKNLKRSQKRASKRGAE